MAPWGLHAIGTLDERFMRVPVDAARELDSGASSSESLVGLLRMRMLMTSLYDVPFPLPSAKYPGAFHIIKVY